ncbi:MAG: SIR2 family NAD-dependent protein deacylase [Deinococcales bacterium]
MTLTVAKDKIQAAKSIAILTGAGISAESGIPTFRDAQTGYWAKYNPHELASPQAFAANPELIWRWYLERFRACQNAQPNAAHKALAQLEEQKPLTLVTQNVDHLHQRAGSKNVLELHGNVYTARCTGCNRLMELDESMQSVPNCQKCGSRMRPNVVWFGETLPHQTLEAAWNAFIQCDIALIVGTSAVVEPAASLGRAAKQAGAYLIEVNPEVTPLSRFANLRVSAGAIGGLAALLE